VAADAEIRTALGWQRSWTSDCSAFTIPCCGHPGGCGRWPRPAHLRGLLDLGADALPSPPARSPGQSRAPFCSSRWMLQRYQALLVLSWRFALPLALGAPTSRTRLGDRASRLRGSRSRRHDGRRTPPRARARVLCYRVFVNHRGTGIRPIGLTHIARTGARRDQPSRRPRGSAPRTDPRTRSAREDRRGPCATASATARATVLRTSCSSSRPRTAPAEHSALHQREDETRVGRTIRITGQRPTASLQCRRPRADTLEKWKTKKICRTSSEDAATAISVRDAGRL